MHTTRSVSHQRRSLESDETFQLLTDASGPALPSSSNGGTTRITIVDDDSTCEYHTYIIL